MYWRDDMEIVSEHEKEGSYDDDANWNKLDRLDDDETSGGEASGRRSDQSQGANFV